MIDPKAKVYGYWGSTQPDSAQPGLDGEGRRDLSPRTTRAFTLKENSCGVA